SAKDVSAAYVRAARLRLAVSRCRRCLASMLVAENAPGPYAKLGLALILFLFSISIKAIQSVDLAPTMYTADQPGRGMTAEYARDAQLTIHGNGLFLPTNWDPADTRLLARAPRHSIL